MELGKDFGQSIHESKIKAGLQAINPMFSFDVGGNLGIHHPKMGRFQGVFLNGQHLCSMSRGMVPEFNVWKQLQHPDGTLYRSHVIMVGWRTTFERLKRKRVVTWNQLQAQFGVEYKNFTGSIVDLYEVA